MSENSGSNGMSQKGLAILVVGAMLIMVGFGAYMGFNLTGHDARTDPHSYVFEGTYGGQPVSGTGHSQYFNENASIYIYRYTFETATNVSFTEVVVLDANGVPDPAFYKSVDDLGSEVMEGQNSHKYRTHEIDNDVAITLTIWVGANNTVLKMLIVHGNIDAEASLSDPVYSITVPGVMTMAAGETKSIEVTWYPTKAPSPSLVWKTSDASIATVDSDGKVTVSSTATTSSTCEITVTSADGKMSAKCTVVVI